MGVLVLLEPVVYVEPLDEDEGEVFEVEPVDEVD